MANLTSITITPSDPFVLISSTQQFILTAHYSDIPDDSTIGSDPTTTWSSSNTSVATVSTTSPTKGLATTLTISGFTIISATYGGFTSTAILRVGLANYSRIVEPIVEGIRTGETSGNAAHNPILNLTLPMISTFTGGVTFSNANASSGGAIGYTIVSGNANNPTELYIANEVQQIGKWVQLNSSGLATTTFNSAQRNLGVVNSTSLDVNGAQLTSGGNPVLVQYLGEEYVFATSPINAGDFLGPDSNGKVKTVPFDPSNPTPILGFAMENYGVSFAGMVKMRIQICGE
jgi:hypothetical protein